jgi:hypothetical protein
MIRYVSWKQFVAVSALTVLLASCSGSVTVNTAGSGGSGGTTPPSSSGSTALANVFGQAFGTASAQGHFQRRGDFTVHGPHAYDSNPLVGCTVNVYGVTGSTIVATGTTDSNGNFQIFSDAMTPGTQYKVVTTCGSDTFTSIIGADNIPPANKTPATVDAVTTLIAVEVIKAVVTAVQAAVTSLQSLPANVQQQVINSLLSPQNVAQVEASVSTVIQTDIDNGTMVIPAPAAASSMSSALVSVSVSSNATTGLSSTTVTDSLNSVTTAETAYTTNSGGTSTTIPPAITNTVQSAANSAAAFPACDSTQDPSIASQSKCTAAVAKLFFNVLHGPVGVLTAAAGASSAFGNSPGIVSCATSDATLQAAFGKPGASVQYFSAALSTNTSSNLCVITPTLGTPNRNSTGINSSGGGGGGLPLFTETSSADGIAVGLLSAMGSSLFAGQNYHLSDLDKIVFSYQQNLNGNPAGFDSRLIYSNTTYSWPIPSGNNGGSYSPYTTTLNMLSGTCAPDSSGNCTGQASLNTSYSWPTSAGGNNCPENSSCDFDPNNGGSNALQYISLSGTNPDWSTATVDTGGGAPPSNQAAFVADVNALLIAIGTSYTPIGQIFLGAYGGPIPSQAQITNQIVNSKQHNDYNPTGEPYYSVLYQYSPVGNDPWCQEGNFGFSNQGQTWINGCTPGTACALSGSGTGTIGAGTQAISACYAQEPNSTYVEQPAVAINVSVAPPSGSVTVSTVSAITAVTSSSTPANSYYLYPVYVSQAGGGNSYFAGEFQLVSTSDGTAWYDENQNAHGLFYVMGTPGSTCSAPVLAGAVGCANGKIYNVSISQNCNGSGACPVVSLTSTAAVTNTASFTVPQQIGVNQTNSGVFYPPNYLSLQTSCGGNGCTENPYVVTVNPSTGAITGVCAYGVTGCTTPPTSASHTFFIAQQNNCSNGGSCTFGGFYLIDSNNVIYTNATPGAPLTTTWTGNSPTTCTNGNPASNVQQGGGANVCTQPGWQSNSPSNVVNYTDQLAGSGAGNNYLTGLGAVFPLDLTQNTSNLGTFDAAALQVSLPTSTPSCSNQFCVQNVLSYNSCNQGGCNSNPYVVTVSVADGSISSICIAGQNGCTSAPSHSNHQYYLVEQMNNSAASGFFLIDFTGNIYTGAHSASGLTNTWAGNAYPQGCTGSCSTSGFTSGPISAAVNYTATLRGTASTGGSYLDAINFPNGSGGSVPFNAGVVSVASNQQNNGGYNPPSYIGINNCSNSGCQQLPFVVTVDGSGDITAACLAGVGSCPTAPSGGKYFMATQQNCNGSGPCTVTGIYLVDSTGAVYTGTHPAGTDQTWSSPPSTCLNSGNNPNQGNTTNNCSHGNWQSTNEPNAVRYGDALAVSGGPSGNYLTSLGNLFPLDSTVSPAMGTFDEAALWIQTFTGPVPNPAYDCTLAGFYKASSNSGIQTNGTNSFGKPVCTTPVYDSPYDVVQYLESQSSNGSDTNAWNSAAGQIQANQNQYQYGDPIGVTSLLNTAFGSWFDGSHSLTTSTNLNAFQSFALIYLLLSGNNNGAHISGILPNAGNGNPQDSFEIDMTPGFGNGNMNSMTAKCGSGLVGPSCGQVQAINTMIGNAIAGFHQ